MSCGKSRSELPELSAYWFREIREEIANLLVRLATRQIQLAIWVAPWLADKRP